MLKAKIGDVKAINFLIEKFKGYVINKAIKYRVNGYDFEDLVQHGYLAIIKSIKKYKHNSNSFTTYCTNTITNSFNELLRKEIKHYREVPTDIIDLEEDYSFSIEDEVIAYMQLKDVIWAINELPEYERNIINNIYIDDKSTKEIESLYNIKYKDIRNLKRRAIRKIKKSLNINE
ncbi:sigma-70 family RNA polymerase sigma factor [Clostridium fallax]|uniref:sigma-70 family RNA polymerase sigma factor n=1 Tax=Clostridium fallax TaxID=1533 RepID=UPI002420108E|nr:sigma-70 family RNA polymerase sigma factor [Clostridium fallax]